MDRTKVFFTFTSRLDFLMVWGSASGCLGLENQSFGNESIAIINTCRNWISDVGPILMTFVALEIGLKFDLFSGSSWGHPRSWAPARLRVIGMVPGR